MNMSIISGNIATDIDKRVTQSGISQCSFRVAVQRRFKDKATGKREADFIQVVAWRQQADFLAQYASKGDKLTVRGAISTRNYEKDGVKHYITEINAEEVELDKKRDNAQTGESRNVGNVRDAVMNGDFVPADDDPELPF